MDPATSQFSPEQWQFLALLEFFGAPVSVDLIGTLVPLPPGPFLDLIQRGEELGLIRRVGSAKLTLSSDLPEHVAAKLVEINSDQRLAKVLEKLEDIEAVREIAPSLRVAILAKAGRHEEAARLEIGLAAEARDREDFDSSMSHFEQALNWLPSLLGNERCASEFVDAAQELSNLAFYLGKRWEILPGILERARVVAEMHGNRRSVALIDLHLGRVFYFGGKRHEALTAFSSGWQVVQDLDDTDILYRSAELIGLYFFMQGLFREALDHLERAVQGSESRKERALLSSLAPILKGYSLLYLGQFSSAIGSLDCSWRFATLRSRPGPATSIRAVLAMALVHIRNWREAAFHISGTKKDAAQTNNDFALYLVSGAEAYRHFLQGRMKEAHGALSETISRGLKAGLVRQYASPWVLQMLFEFERLGFDSIAGMTFQNQTDRILEEPNVHLQGVALRLQARKSIGQGEEPSITDMWLQLSEEHLLRSEDPLELARTRLERARLRLREGDRAAASEFATKARLELSGPLEEFYPDDLRHLLDASGTTLMPQQKREELVERFLDLLQALLPSADPEELLVHTVSATNRLFSAERGAIFWFRRDDPGKSPQLRAGYNLTADQVSADEFKPNLKLVCKAFRDGKPLIFRPGASTQRSASDQVTAVLCIPFQVQGHTRGVLYHDNCYLNDCFDSLDSSLMLRLAQHLTTYVDRILRFSSKVQEASKLAVETTMQIGEVTRGNFVAQSQGMIRVIEQADRIAESETTVLILGETGVGKELLANRIHARSPRRDGPFVVVDPTTIPEHLVESELFGHEKGAFTGADRQKLGRFELADSGTLFVDEVGEVPATVQPKLLRAIQEKTFYRVGGTQVRKSDFRLVAATNRDLATEVAAGRFREDLYYRIGVIELEVPPLRERPEDVIALANQFLAYYATKYSRPWVKLSGTHEDWLTTYQWPGNVRELKNVIERAVVMSSADSLELDLSGELAYRADHPFSNHPTLEEVQRRYITYVLEKTGGRISGPEGAAEILGMKRSTLNARMRKLGLR